MNERGERLLNVRFLNGDGEKKGAWSAPHPHGSLILISELDGREDVRRDREARFQPLEGRLSYGWEDRSRAPWGKTADFHEICQIWDTSHANSFVIRDDLSRKGLSMTA